MCHKFTLGRLIGGLIVRILVTPVSVYLSVNMFNYLLKTTGPIKPDSLGCRIVCSNDPRNMTIVAAIYSRNI